MNEWIHPRERTLGRITLVLGVLVWIGLLVGTFGAALIGLGIGFLFYVFVQSALVAHIKGNGVELTAQQFPALHEQLLACCQRLQISRPPQAYVLQGHGGLNAFATRFLGTQYVVLMSDVVDAMETHPDGVSFYLGHELGHLRMKHLNGQLLRWPVLWLPLLGAAYSRARESTCDRHGAACCSSPENAAKAMSALAAGAHAWPGMDMSAYVAQAGHARGFWMSFHELTSGYPWLTKRVARLLQGEQAVPGRHSLAYVLAAFFPYAGRMGAGFGLLILVYVIGVVAAVAIPAYQDYTVKAKLESAYQASTPARTALSNQYEQTRKVPESLAAVGVAERLADGSSLQLNPDNMTLTLVHASGTLVFTPSLDAQDKVIWRCEAGDKLRSSQLPPSCQTSPPQRR